MMDRAKWILILLALLVLVVAGLLTAADFGCPPVVGDGMGWC